MQFQLFHNKFFKARNGSYSVVTEREEFDSQITLTDVESEMVINFFNRSNIHVGNVNSNKLKSQKTFLLYPTFKPINLNLVFPKPNKTELRLYISSRAGFKPKSGEIWFLYIDENNQIVIGSFQESVWNELDQVDIDDNEYLDEIQDEIKNKKRITSIPKAKIVQVQIGSKLIYKRNPTIAVASLIRANFTCEIDKNHKTFIAEKSKSPYVEAHHFVPMKFQSEFSFPLDNVDNVIALCPICHRGIHLGEVSYKRMLIETLYNFKPAINNFRIEDLYSFYNSLKYETGN